MIQAREIRLGNYFQDRKGRLCEVLRLSKHPDEVRISVIEGAVTSLPIEPIPLNEEWLLKFGFKYDKIDRQEFYTLHYFDCKFLFTEGRIKLGIQGVSQYHWIPAIIDYVHEFQNAYFFLTGEELV